MLLEFLLRVIDRVVVPPINRAYGRLALSRVGFVGRNVRVHGRIAIHSPGQLQIGDHVRIGAGCLFFCMGGLSIGANTQISRNVVIYTGNHDFEGNGIPYDDNYRLAPVSIGESVWIGMNAAILPGVSIGDGAIIGLGTIVTKDVPAGAIVVGAAQRIIRRRNMDAFRVLRDQGRLFGSVWPER